MPGYGETISFSLDFSDLAEADDILKTLLTGRLHDEAPQNVTVWTDIPESIRAQWESTRGLIHDWALDNLAVVPDRDNPPAIHVNWSFNVPDGQIPWGDNPGEGGFFPMGVTLQMEWVDPTELIDRPEPPAR